MYAFPLSTEAESCIRFEIKDYNCSAYAFSFLSEDFKTNKCRAGHCVFQFLDSVDIHHSIIFSVIQGYQWIACVVFLKIKNFTFQNIGEFMSLQLCFV